jgi:DNA-binding response OmpR family regulator
MMRLLHVDDDDDILEISRIALEISGDIELVQCASGEEAIRKVNDFIPDVFLLDVMMPVMSGPQTLEKLRERLGLENVPAIFMTARTSTADKKQLFDLGAIDVISKPFDPLTLSAQIKSALNALR